jgi:hypothetical protein
MSTRQEFEAALQARRELGEEMEPEIVDAFVDRIERTLAKRERVDEGALYRRREYQKEMILGSMGISVPLFALAAIFTGIEGVVAVCLMLAIIAIVVSRQP